MRRETFEAFHPIKIPTLSSTPTPEPEQKRGLIQTVTSTVRAWRETWRRRRQHDATADAINALSDHLRKDIGAQHNEIAQFRLQPLIKDSGRWS